DEIVIWDRVLSSSEISELYNSSVGEYTYTDQDLTCALNNSNDPDDDSIKAIYNWYSVLVVTGGISEGGSCSQHSDCETGYCATPPGICAQGTPPMKSLTVLNMPFETMESKHHDINNSDMVGAWFMEGDGTDRTHNQKDGVIGGSPGLIDGKVGLAYNFSGSSDELDLGTNYVDLGTTWTISAWFMYPLAPMASYNTLTRGNANDHQIIVRRSDMQLGMYDNAFGGAFRGTGFYMNTLSNNSWHHITAEGSSGAQKFYIDGEYVGSSDTQSTTDVRSIGAHWNPTQAWGVTDEAIIWNRSLTADEIRELYLEGLDSEEDAKDYSGYDNKGAVVGATYNKTGGIDGFGAYEFDGIDDYINLGNDGSLRNEDGTISAWVKSTDDWANSLTAFGDTDGNSWFAVWLGNGSTGYLTNEIITIITGDSGSSTVNRIGYTTENRDELFDGNWHHVAVTAGSSYGIYLDGEPRAVTVGRGSDDGVFTNTTGIDNARIGASNLDNYGNINFFNGTIDEVLIFNHSLSPEQVKLLYESGLSTISYKETEYPEMWKCSVTPTDGDPDGPTYNSSETNITKKESDLDIWDTSNVGIAYTGTPVTFYANYSSTHPSELGRHISNANCSIGFSDGEYDMPEGYQVLWDYNWTGTASGEDIAYDVVGVRDVDANGDATISMYLDGVFKYSNSVTHITDTDTEPLTFGRYSYTGSAKFNGTIDEIVIWDRVLSSSEISEL
ncbi:LamG-like jellyroll fold domain-containing protein, partial [Nanoarchaeota archaeon]